MIKYIGSKRLLIPHILRVVQRLPQVSTVVDMFSGTCRVGAALKRKGYSVQVNDHNAYAFALGRCYVQADRKRWLPEVQKLIHLLQRLPPKRGYFTETFCERSRFFQPHNGARVDAMREQIARWELEPELEAILLTSLMEAADRVDSTTGLQMAYLKEWAPRSYNDLELRVPDLIAGDGRASCADAEHLAKDISADLVYLDPPYNQHSYLGNYHIWETLVRWDKPEVYGVACKRVDCRERKSMFNSRPRCLSALRKVIMGVDCKYILLSFNNEGYIEKRDLIRLLSKKGYVAIEQVDYKRYVGAQIGIHNPSGHKVGRVSHLRNKEALFLVGAQGSVEHAIQAAVGTGHAVQPALL